MKWERVSDYCIRNGDYTICKIGSANGWSYELWRKQEQIAVGMDTADKARAVCASEQHDEQRAKTGC